MLSLVISKCGARRVISTDMQHAMPLLRYNISLNDQRDTSPDATEPACPYTLTCPSGHNLAESPAECEDFMCNICDFDIDEGDSMWRCPECNFDVCETCATRVHSQDMSTLPTWYRVHLQEMRRVAMETGGVLTGGDKKSTIQAYPYDWSETSCLFGLSSLLQGEGGEEGGRKVIVASDVTYNRMAVELFFIAVAQVTNMFHAMSTLVESNSETSPSVDVIFLHHTREADTELLMLQHVVRLLHDFPAPGSTEETRLTDKTIQCEVFEVYESNGRVGDAPSTPEGQEGVISSVGYEFSAGVSLVESFPGVSISGSGSSSTELLSREGNKCSVEDCTRTPGGKMRIFVMRLYPGQNRDT